MNLSPMCFAANHRVQLPSQGPYTCFHIIDLFYLDLVLGMINRLQRRYSTNAATVSTRFEQSFVDSRVNP